MVIRRDEETLASNDTHPPLSPSNVYDYLANLFYARRSKINPLWNAVLVGGWDPSKKERWVYVLQIDGSADRDTAPLLLFNPGRLPMLCDAPTHSVDPVGSFLGYVDLLGTTYSAPTLATGFGAAMAQPLLREAYEAKAGIDGTGELLTADEAEKLLDECMKVLLYRDARSLNKASPFPSGLFALGRL